MISSPGLKASERSTALQPEVAFAMVQLGLPFDDMHTALDLEEGLALLNRQLASRKSSIGRDGVG